MILTLEVAGPPGETVGVPRKTFDRVGGTIGRHSSNTWVLAHPYVSSHHAAIRYSDGAFTIEDTKSANGVFVNSSTNRLSAGQRHPLKTGDSIFIDPFEIHVSIAPRSSELATPFPGDPLTPATRAPFDPPLRGKGNRSAGPNSGDESGLVAHEYGDQAPSGDSVMRKLGVVSPPVPDVKGLQAEKLAESSPLQHYYRPPEVTAPEEIPEGWLDDHMPPVPSVVKDPPVAKPTKDPGGSRSGSHHAAKGAKRPPDTPAWKQQGGAQPSGGRQADQGLKPTGRDEAFGERARRDLAAVLAGAGLDVGDVTPELAKVFGQILQVVVTGVIDVLHARQSIRDEFRIGATMFEPQGLNNPLKFSTNAQDALYNLLVKRSPGYLGPVEAFEDAFEDLKSHEIAMLEGMRVAFEMMLEKFSPDRLQKEFDQKGARLPVVGSLRYWEQYRERFHDMVSDADSAFRELFGEEFASAYDDQLKRLKTRRRGRKTRKSESSTSSDA